MGIIIINTHVLKIRVLLNREVKQLPWGWTAPDSNPGSLVCRAVSLSSAYPAHLFSFHTDQCNYQTVGSDIGSAKKVTQSMVLEFLNAGEKHWGSHLLQLDPCLPCPVYLLVTQWATIELSSLTFPHPLGRLMLEPGSQGNSSVYYWMMFNWASPLLFGAAFKFFLFINHSPK